MRLLRWFLGAWCSSVLLMVLSVMLLVSPPWGDQVSAVAQIAYMIAFYAVRLFLVVLAAALVSLAVKTGLHQAFHLTQFAALPVGLLVSTAVGGTLMAFVSPSEPLFAVVGLVSAAIGELAAGAHVIAKANH